MGLHAQASLFLILSVLIVTIAGVFFSQQSGLRMPVLPALSDVGVVGEFIAACLSQSAREAASLFYMQDSDVDLFPLIESGGKIVWWPVWYDRGKNNLPEDVNPWIADYAQEAQLQCTSVLQTFPVAVQERGISIAVNLEEDGVRVILHQPVVVGGEKDQTLLSDLYNQEVNLRVKIMLEVARGILGRIQEEPDQIPVEFIIDQAITHKLKVTYAYLEDDGKTDPNMVVYEIQDLLAGQNIDNPYIKFIARMM